jgi:hypothetical protein
MLDYVTSFVGQDRPNLQNTVPPQTLDELSGAPPPAPSNSPAPAPAPKPRSIATPPRLVVVGKPFTLRVTNAKAQEIYDELKSLQLAHHKHAISVLLRVFLEISVDHRLGVIGSKTTFIDPKSGRELDKNLQSKVKECVDDFVAKGANAKEFSAVSRALSVSTSPMSTQTLHSYVHNLFATPIQADLTAAWDNAKPLFDRIWP